MKNIMLKEMFQLMFNNYITIQAFNLKKENKIIYKFFFNSI